MPVIIPDEAIREAGLSEQEALTEIACHLYDAAKLSFPSAARLAGLSRTAFEQELRGRRIAVYRPTPEDLTDDLDAFQQLGL